jgi:cold shock CspA family protein
VTTKTLTGTIETLLPEKGFGFIVGSDGETYFFHRTDADDFPIFRTGTPVVFTPTVGAKGPRAANVQLQEL